MMARPRYPQQRGPSGAVAGRARARAECASMQLYRATALIAVLLIVALSAGYAAGEITEDDQDLTRTASEESRS